MTYETVPGADYDPFTEPRRDMFADQIKVALGDRPAQDPMDKLKTDLKKLHKHATEFLEQVKKLASELGVQV